MTAIDILMWFVKLWATASFLPIAIYVYLIIHESKIKSVYDGFRSVTMGFASNYPAGYLLSPSNAPSTINQKTYLNPLEQRENAVNALCEIAPKFGLEVDITDDQATVSDPLAEQILQAAAEVPFVYIEID